MFLQFLLKLALKQVFGLGKSTILFDALHERCQVTDGFQYPLPGACRKTTRDGDSKAFCETACKLRVSRPPSVRDDQVSRRYPEQFKFWLCQRFGAFNRTQL